jgi:uncharacterized protein (TIGR03435 family)
MRGRFLLAGLGAAALFAASPAFEAASVKPVPVDARVPLDFRITGGRLISTNWTLDLLMREAYGLRSSQISGGPNWVNSDRFSIEAVASGDPGREQMLLMLQGLLEDRFKLKVHRETKEGNVYVLSVAKGGPKLKPPKEGDPSFVHMQRMTPNELPGVLYAHVGQNASMAQLCEALWDQLHAPVLDRTGVTGNWDFRVEYAVEGAAAEAGPSIFTAVQSQLGLRLEAAKGPLETLVIDHAEKPSEN